MKTLNGLVQKVCVSASPEPFALAVDVEQQYLYWVSVESNVVFLNQLRYGMMACGRLVHIMYIRIYVHVHVEYYM